MGRVTKGIALKQGFTLVELSIVIIIIGFLIAGISAGTSLIKQAEINSIISDIQNNQTSYNNFVLRYGAVPGDMADAVAYFNNCAQTNLNCNGLIEFATGLPDESYSAWRTLSLANMISAGIVLIPDGWVGVELLGSTIPVSKITGAGYIMSGPNTNFGAGTLSPWIDGLTNAVFIGKVSATGLGNAVLKPEDSYNIDKEVDDGSIDVTGAFAGGITGNFRSTGGADAVITIGATACSNVNGHYTLTTLQPACVSGLALN
jgi:prepilin-type N-terminal cleavage/methylation domain-containing protein